MIQISTNNRIIFDGEYTGLSISQRKEGTVIFTPECPPMGIEYREHKMPHARYSSASVQPACGVGCDQLEADIKNLMAQK